MVLSYRASSYLEHSRNELENQRTDSSILLLDYQSASKFELLFLNFLLAAPIVDINRLGL